MFEEKVRKGHRKRLWINRRWPQLVSYAESIDGQWRRGEEKKRRRREAIMITSNMGGTGLFESTKVK